MRQARAAGRLSHPDIATIYDIGGDEDGERYIAMEYVDGWDLYDLIQRESPLAQSRVLRLFVQLCSALDYAHAAGAVHRDVNPGNIMVTRGESVKVVDFGIARMDSSSLTQAGMVLGTPSYRSPEQIMGRPLDRRSDIFSLGVVLYGTLTVEKPFAGEHWTTVSFEIVNQPPHDEKSDDQHEKQRCEPEQQPERREDGHQHQHRGEGDLESHGPRGGIDLTPADAHSVLPAAASPVFPPRPSATAARLASSMFSSGLRAVA